MPRYDSRKTTVLAELRESARATQDEAAAYFGLTGKKRRESVAGWERGTSAPSQARRERFISYLWDRLNLRRYPSKFQEVWNDVMVGEWHWLPLANEELPADYFDSRQFRALQAPFQAVRDLPHFVGRRHEIEQLTEALTREKHDRIYCLEGAAGVGKTALAARLAHQLRSHFPDGVLWAEPHASNTMSLLHAFAAAYKQDVSHYKTVESRSQVVRAILADKRALMVLDDVASSEHVKPLLPPTGACAVLITTRYRHLSVIRTARHYPVGPFGEDTGEALELFAEIFDRRPTHEEERLLIELAQLLGQLPLALDIAASRLAHEPSWTVESFLERVRTEAYRLGELKYEDLSVRASFSTSFESLIAELQEFFPTLGVFGGEDFDVEAVAYITNTANDEALRNLRSLVSYSLVTEARPDRFQLHPLLRDYARERIVTDHIFQRMAEYYDGVLNQARTLYEQGDDGVSKGLKLFDREWGNVRAGHVWAEAHADQESAAVLCSDYLLSGGFVLHLRLHPQERINWYQAGVTAARRLNNREAEASHLIGLGVSYHDAGDMQQAIVHLEEALIVLDEVNDEAKKCSALDKLGLIHTRLGQFEQAILFHEQALRIAHELADQQREGNVLANLGIAYKNLQRFEQAVEYQKQSLAISRAMGDRYGESTSLNDLGTAYLESGQLEHAIETYKTALPVLRQIGYRHGEADTLGNLGYAYSKLGAPERAIVFYQKALRIDRESGNTFGEAITLSNLAEEHLAINQPQRALALSEQALALAQEYDYTLIEGDALFGLSLAEYEIGDESQAISNAKTALEIFERMDDPKADEVREKLDEWTNSKEDIS